MRIFLDTNVLISALTTRGLCWDLLELTSIEHQLLTSKVVLQELARVLAGKFKIPQAAITASLRYIRALAEVAPESQDIDPVVPDPDDIPIIACALAAKAQVFITGDKVLLDMQSIAGMSIISPREFWEQLRLDA